MNEKNKGSVHIILILIIFGIIGAISFTFMRSGKISLPIKSSAPQVCTLESKICPNGTTAVVRGGPNCEFAACPETTKYENKNLGFSLELVPSCSVVSEELNKVVIGCNAYSIKNQPTIIISKGEIIDKNSLPNCDKVKFQSRCVTDSFSSELIEYDHIGQNKAKSFILVKGCVPEGDCGESTIVHIDGKPNFQIEIIPWSSGITTTAYDILRSFKFF